MAQKQYKNRWLFTLLALFPMLGLLIAVRIYLGYSYENWQWWLIFGSVSYFVGETIDKMCLISNIEEYDPN